MEVTSTVGVASDVQPRPRLAELAGVNELPQAHRVSAL